MKTIDTDEFKTAIHLSKLIPLGHKLSEAKKIAVRKWNIAIKNGACI